MLPTLLQGQSLRVREPRGPRWCRNTVLRARAGPKMDEAVPGTEGAGAVRNLPNSCAWLQTSHSKNKDKIK